jgi:hypothetical protein
MNNAELAEAITAAYNRSGKVDESQRLNMEHLKALLAEQLKRAREPRMYRIEGKMPAGEIPLDTGGDPE